MNGNGSSVTWQWVAGSMLGLLVLGGGAWMRTTWAEMAQIKTEAMEDRKAGVQIKSDVEVIKERTRRQEDDIKEIRENLKQQDRKLDELLRRVK